MSPDKLGDLIADVIADAARSVDEYASLPLHATSEADTIRVPPPPPPLSRRTLAFALAEAERWGGQVVPQKDVAQYFKTVERGIGGDGKPIVIGGWFVSEIRKGRRFSHCAAFVGYCERMASIDGDVLPPHRAGALEIMRDAQQGLRPGQKFVSLEEVLDTHSYPHPGAIAIYSNVAAPERGHTEINIVASVHGYRSVGGNEQGGRCIVDVEPIPWSKAANADGSQRLKLEGWSVDEELPPTRRTGSGEHLQVP